MDEIRPWLFIGAYRDTLNKSYLDLESIRAMLQLGDQSFERVFRCCSERDRGAEFV